MLRTTKDERTIRTGKDYTEFRYELHERQERACIKCSRHTFLAHPLEWDDSFHVHHVGGRGLGGSKRDDTFESCRGLCGKCHRKEHNQ